MRYWMILTALLAALPTVTTAGDAASLHFIGFSEDNKYLAFEQYGIHDGSGLSYVELFVIDVEKNEYALKPSKLEGEPEASQNADEPWLFTQLRDTNRASIQSKLKTFGLLTATTGQPLITHPLTDLAADPVKVRFASRLPLSGTVSERYEITLKMHDETGKDDCKDLPVKRFSLHLRNLDGGESVTLQNDKSLPPARGCVQQYRIQDVYLHKGKLAVFLNLFTPGFEGENLRYLVVTGTLPVIVPTPSKSPDRTAP